MSEMLKKWGVTDFVLGRTSPEEHLNLSKSCFVSEEDLSGCKSAKYGLNGPIKQIESTGEVPQRISSHLATIVSRALQPQDGRMPCPVGRNIQIF